MSNHDEYDLRLIARALALLSFTTDNVKVAQRCQKLMTDFISDANVLRDYPDLREGETK